MIAAHTRRERALAARLAKRDRKGSRRCAACGDRSHLELCWFCGAQAALDELRRLEGRFDA